MFRILIQLLYKLPNAYFPYVLEKIISFFASKSNHKNGIVVINTHDRSGGAAKIAFQIAASIQKTSPISMLVKYKDRDENWIHPLPSNNEVFSVFFSIVGGDIFLVV